MNIQAYLTFNGSCRDAMTFYKECIGGSLQVQTVGESPLAEKIPPHFKEWVLQATLTRGELVLLASDMVEERGLVVGNSVSLFLNCNSADEATACYNKLSAAGTQTQPLQKTFWGALFGGLIDRYGNNWLVHCQGGW